MGLLPNSSDVHVVADCHADGSIADIRAAIDRQRDRIFDEIETYRVLEKQAIVIYDGEVEYAERIRRFKNEHGLA